MCVLVGEGVFIVYVVKYHNHPKLRETFNNVYIRFLDYNWTWGKTFFQESHEYKIIFFHFLHSSLIIVCGLTKIIHVCNDYWFKK
jgi:hypothetical protein